MKEQIETLTAKELMQRETEWYQIHGQHMKRLVRDSEGVWYPIGDWSWNRENPEKPEYIEPAMRDARIHE